MTDIKALAMDALVAWREHSMIMACGYGHEPERVDRAMVALEASLTARSTGAAET